MWFHIFTYLISRTLLTSEQYFYLTTNQQRYFQANIKGEALGAVVGQERGSSSLKKSPRRAAMDMELEHGGDEDERGSESSSSTSKRSFGASSDATVSSTPSKLQALRFAEDLSLPSVHSLPLCLISLS